MRLANPKEGRAYARGRADERKAQLNMGISPVQGAAADSGQLKASDARFRSFAERYVIARADKFRLGYEAEDGHAAILMARTIYNMTKAVGRTIDLE
jgi:hypothetical protein